MDTDLNHCVLAGVLECAPITRFADHGTQMTGFTLTLTEPGPAGQEFRLVVPRRERVSGWQVAVDVVDHDGRHAENEPRGAGTPD